MPSRVRFVAVAALVAATGCGDDRPDRGTATGTGASAPPSATSSVEEADVPVATGATETVRLIVTPADGVTPEAVAEQLEAALGTDLVAVDVQRATLVVTVPTSRRGDVEAAPGVAAVQDDAPDTADG